MAKGFSYEGYIEHTHVKNISKCSNTKYCEVIPRMKLLIISVTWDTPQNRVSDTITHVALNTINGIV